MTKPLTVVVAGKKIKARSIIYQALKKRQDHLLKQGHKVAPCRALPGHNVMRSIMKRVEDESPFKNSETFISLAAQEMRAHEKALGLSER